MPKTSPRQRKTVGRLMHEYEHGELGSGPEGKGGKVKNCRQAIAIALSEAGASKYDSNKPERSLGHTEIDQAKAAIAHNDSHGFKIFRRGVLLL